jgi:hypothetical protein
MTHISGRVILYSPHFRTPQPYDMSTTTTTTSGRSMTLRISSLSGKTTTYQPIPPSSTINLSSDPSTNRITWKINHQSGSEEPAYYSIGYEPNFWRQGAYPDRKGEYETDERGDMYRLDREGGGGRSLVMRVPGSEY